MDIEARDIEGVAATGLVALIAHDGKKPDMADLARRFEALLAAVPLVATATTGQVIEAATGLRPRKLLSGPLGGDFRWRARGRGRYPQPPAGSPPRPRRRIR